MTGYHEVVGQEDVVGHFRKAIATGRVSHSYILSGETGAGKKMLASAFAMALQCDRREADPCGVCASCRKAMNGNHPDIIRIRHEKPGTISIDEIRRQLVGDVTIRPYCGPRKIYLVDEAEKLTPQAQNALLKTIEEPPEYAVILLLTGNTDALLPTIRSRCVKLELRPVSDAAVKKYLMERLQVPDYQAELDASMARGNIGRAREIAASGEMLRLTETSLEILKKADGCETGELAEIIRRLAEDRLHIGEYLELFRFWYRDVLLWKASGEQAPLMFRQEIPAIKKQAEERSYENLERILEALEKTGVRLRANVNFDLAMELLFLTVREKR